MMKSNISEAACVTHGGVIMSMLAQRGMPRRAPELWMADSGCGYLLQCSPELWMPDGIVEVSDIIPFGYLDEESCVSETGGGLHFLVGIHGKVCLLYTSRCV